MTRDELVQQFRVIEGRVQDGGKFCGQPIWVAYYWGLAQTGGADQEIPENNEYVFDLDDEDRMLWPELGNAQVLYLWEDSDEVRWFIP